MANSNKTKLRERTLAESLMKSPSYSKRIRRPKFGKSYKISTKPVTKEERKKILEKVSPKKVEKKKPKTLIEKIKDRQKRLEEALSQ